MLIYSAASAFSTELSNFLFYAPIAAFHNHPVWMIAITAGSIALALSSNNNPASLIDALTRKENGHSNKLVSILEGVMFACFIGSIVLSAPTLTLGGAIWALTSKLVLPSAAATVATLGAAIAIDEEDCEIEFSIGAAAFNMALAFACEASWPAITVGLYINLIAGAVDFISGKDTLGLANRSFAPVIWIADEGIDKLFTLLD